MGRLSGLTDEGWLGLMVFCVEFVGSYRAVEGQSNNYGKPLLGRFGLTDGTQSVRT